MKPTLLVLHVTLLTGSCFCQSALNVSQLHDDLLTLNPNVRPVSNMSEPTEVNVTFQLISIVDLDTASQKMTSNGWMSVYWMNHYMTWNPRNYGGVTLISPSADDMWRPRLTVRNSLTEIKPIGEQHVFVNLQNNGLVSWHPGERFETSCKVDITFFPFDTQQCTWELFAWGESSAAVKLRSALPYIDMRGYQENGEWNVIGTKAWAEHTCNNQSISMVYFEVTLRRRAVLLFMTLLLPPVVLSFVNVFVFTIPAESGERLAYCMTSFLTYGVFMSFIVNFLPSSSQTVSLLALNLSLMLAFSAIIVLFCILTLRLFHRDSIKRPVPPTLHAAIVRLEMLMCLHPPSHGSTPVVQTQDDFAGCLGAEEKDGQPQCRKDKCCKEKRKQEAHSQFRDMTWQRVSRTLDKLLFRVFFTLALLTTFVFLLFSACQN